MSCGGESMSWENGLIRDMRLERIADVWEYRCTVKYNKRVSEIHRREDERKKQADQQQKFQDKYFDPWCKELEATYHRLAELRENWEAGENVTPADWDAVTVGRECKAIHLVSGILPKEAWPLPVRDRFPNLIAFFDWDWDVRLREPRQKQYVKIVDDITDNFVHTKVFDHKKRYGDIVKHFAEQNTITLEQNRLADDIYAGRQAGVVVEEIVTARSDRNSTRPSLNDMLLAHLRYEDVMDQDFDAHAWVRKIYYQKMLSCTRISQQRAAQMVHAWAKYWQTTPGDVSGANRVTPEPSQAHGCDIPYDCTHLYDEREPKSSVEITKTSNNKYEDELCVPAEPVRDQFRMDLNDDTEHDGEYFLPFDT